MHMCVYIRTQALGNSQTHYSYMHASGTGMHRAHAEIRRASLLPTSSNSLLADIIWTAPSMLLQGSSSKGK